MEIRAYTIEDVKVLWRKLIRWMPQKDHPIFEMHEYPAPDGLMVRMTARRARCRYEDKDIVKAAGFRWDGAMKQWYTTDAAVAAKLDDVEGLRQRIASANTAKVEAIEMSRASDSDADIPRPEGLEYLPYQRAGIAYARRFPTVLIGDDPGLGKTIQAARRMIGAARSAKLHFGIPSTLHLTFNQWSRCAPLHPSILLLGDVCGMHVGYNTV